MYQFRANAHISGVSAEDAGQELERLYKEHGRLTAQIVVEAAEPENAPLHPLLEWDDSIAGHQHRLWQARQLIRVVLIREAPDSLPRSIYVHVSRGDGYQPMTVVVQRADWFEQARAEMRRRLDADRTALDDLMEAAKASGIPERLAATARVAQGIDAARDALVAVT